MAVCAVFFNKLKKVLHSHKRLPHSQISVSFEFEKYWCLAILKYSRKCYWFYTCSPSHSFTAVGWNRKDSIFLNSALAVNVSTCADPSSLGFTPSAGSGLSASVPALGSDALKCKASKRCRREWGEQWFSSHRKLQSPRMSVVLGDYQHLTHWEEGKAWEMFFSSWCLHLDKEV